MVFLYHAAEREKDSNNSRKTVMMTARGSRYRKRRGTIERIRCFGCGQLGYEKVDSFNRDPRKIGNGDN